MGRTGGSWVRSRGGRGFLSLLSVPPDYAVNEYTTTMHGNEYQSRALDTAIYPNQGSNFVYPLLGMVGEAGEVADKLKKVIRDNDGVLTDPVRDAVAKELGDTMWYVAVLAHELDYSLDEILAMNLAKLASRKERGVLTGSGDYR